MTTPDDLTLRLIDADLRTLHKLAKDTALVYACDAASLGDEAAMSLCVSAVIKRIDAWPLDIDGIRTIVDALGLNWSTADRGRRIYIEAGEWLVCAAEGNYGEGVTVHVCALERGRDRSTGDLDWTQSQHVIDDIRRMIRGTYRPADTPIPAPFRAGDRVEMIAPAGRRGGGDVPISTIGTITGAVDDLCPGFGDGWYVEWDYGYRHPASNWAYYSRQLRLATDD